MTEDLPILQVDDLQISFRGEQSLVAVKHISFSIGRGETLAVVGESGSGKSVTALALMGLLPGNAIATGSAKLNTRGIMHEQNGQSYNLLQPNKARGRDISMVFQEPMSALNPLMSVGDQVLEAILAHQKITRKEAKIAATGWLGKVHLPQPDVLYHKYPHQLSGGQKQRVMIAMAMCNNPTLLIADEPTTALDVTVQQEIVRLMQYLQQEHGTSMLFITHDLALAGTIADAVMVMYKGDVVEYGDAKTLLKSPQHAYTRALLACRPTPEQKGSILPTVADFMESTNGFAHVSNAMAEKNEVQLRAEVLLEVRDLKVGFSRQGGLFGGGGIQMAVDGVSFSLNRGEILGLAGESGCGKSTLSKALIGLLPVTAGAILFEQQDLAIMAGKEWRAVRKKIQMIFQDPYSSLNPRMTVGDILREPMYVHGIARGRELDAEVARLLALVQLPADAAGRYPHQFSGGQRQRVGIARALSVRPEFIICDESVSALDVSIQAQILNLLKSLQQELGLTLLFISHDLNVVQYISDRVMIMKAGKIVETGDAVAVLQHPEHEYTRKLVSAIPRTI